MQGLSSILSLSRNEFESFNNTGARISDSIYHMALKVLFCVKKSRFFDLLCNVTVGVITKYVNH